MRALPPEGAIVTTAPSTGRCCSSSTTKFTVATLVESAASSRSIAARVSGLSEAGRKQVEATIQAQNGELLSSGNPTTTLEELFLRVIEESEAHPGRRVHGGGGDNGKGGSGDGN